MSDLGSSRLDTDRLPESERFELFRRGLAASHDAHRTDGDDRPFRARLDAWLIGDMVVTAGRQSASRMVRTAERCQADGLDYFTFILVRDGVVSGDAGGPVAFGTGEVAILDLAKPADLVTSDNGNIGVRLSRTRLRDALRSGPDLHGRIIGGVAARLAADHFASLVRHAPMLSRDDIETVVEATTALLTTCIAATSGQPVTAPGNGARSVRDKVVRHIDANLTSDLSPATLCRRLSVSRSSLYRAFLDRGGVSAFVRERRLDAVDRLLRDPSDRQTIAQLAYAHGFASDAHFSTIFRRRFGRSPRDARKGVGSKPLGRGETLRTGTTVAAYRTWLAGLVSSVP